MLNRKSIIAITLLVSTVAMADTIAYINNNNGGKIELTNNYCGTNNEAYFEGGMVALAYGHGGNTAYGCWYWDKKMAVARVKWADGTYSTYQADSINMIN